MVQKTEYIQGNGEINKAVTSFGYKADGNLTRIKTPKGAEIRKTYDADSRMMKERILDNVFKYDYIFVKLEMKGNFNEIK